MKGKIAFIVLSILLAVTIGYSADISAYSYLSSAWTHEEILSETPVVATEHQYLPVSFLPVDEALLHAASDSVNQTLAELREAARLKEEEEKRAREIQTATENESSDELYWLYRVVTLESGDEMGQLLVTNVILNRARIGNKTVSEVIFAPGQFDPVSNGAIYYCTPTESAIRAVERALAGEDYSEGALYFVAEYCDYSWFEEHLSFLFQYGAHRFYK